MHEASLVSTLLHQVSELRIQHQADAVEEIVVEIGPLSGVESLLIRSAFDRLAPDHGMEHTRLVIREIPLEAKCLACDALFEIERFKFLCTHCGATNIQVIRGDEVRLVNIAVRQSVQGNTVE